MKRLCTLFFLIVSLLMLNLPEVKSQTWCIPTWSNYGNYQIGTQYVQIGTITNTTTCPTAVPVYNSYTGMSTAHSHGAIVNYNIQVGGANTTWFCIYIDFNNDGTFNTGDERVVSSGNISASTYSSGTFTVPLTAPLGSKRMRVISDYGGMGTPPSPCGPNYYAGEAEDYTFVVMPQPGLDATLSTIDSPVVFGVGTNYLVVSYQNMRCDTINKVALGYRFENNTPVFVQNIACKLGPLQSGQYRFATPVNIGSPGTYNIKAWVTKPNDSFPDNNRSNDTLKKTICTGMSGTYSIGTSGNYSTFNAAISAVNTCGIVGPIVFNVQPGIYNERVVIPYILGVDANKTITFRGSGKTTSILSYTDNLSKNLSTVVFNGANYIRFENMTIQNPGLSYTRAFFFTKQANYNKISGCIVRVSNTYSGGYTNAIEAGSTETSFQTPGNNANYNTIENCDIIGGYFGILFYGAGSTSVCTGNIFRGNIFRDQYYYGIYLYYMGNTTIQRNFIDIGHQNKSAYGIQAYFCTHTVYDGNIINPGVYGICTFYENNDFTKDSTVFVNNMIYGFKDTTQQVGIKAYNYNYGIRIYNNTFKVDGSYANDFNYSAVLCYNVYNLKISKNIFYTSNGTMLLSIYPYPYGNLAEINYNDYYHPAGFKNWFYCNGIYYNNVTNWKTASSGILMPHDANSFDNVNPNFMSATDLHLKLQWTPLKAPGNWLEWDVDGNARCRYETTLGADEVLAGGLKPKAGFLSNDSICIGSYSTFLNLASPTEPKGHSWFINGIFQANSLNFSYVSNIPGKDTIMLVTDNCYGVDTLTKVITSGSSSVRPIADFVCNKNEGEIYDTFNLFDLSANCPIQWKWEVYPALIYDQSLGGIWMPSFEFRPGVNDSTQNTTIWFNYPGKYRICLIAGNVQGSDTLCKSDYISINATSVMCMWPLEVNTLKGTVFDDVSGPGYQKPANSTACGLYINTCADTLTFILTEFDVKTGDYLRIYQGSNDQGLPLWNKINFPNGIGNGRTLADPGFQSVFVSTNGKIYLQWYRIGGTPAMITGGFVGKWIGKVGNQPLPVPYFICPDTLCMNVPITFENKSSGYGNFYIWRFDHLGVSSADFNPTHTYTSVGLDTVLLEATNCTGSSYYQKQIYVNQPYFAPKPNFFADIRFPVAGFDNVNLSDSSIGCAESYHWSITPSTYTPLAGFPSTANAKVRFDSTGYYTVKLIVGYNGRFDSITKTNYIKAIRYCTPVVSNLNADVGIGRVKIGAIDNSSPIGLTAYTDYANTATAYLDLLGTYTLSVYRNSTFNSMNRKAWIDFNIDGDFDDPGELIGSESLAQTLVWNTNVSIPSTVSIGATRMRIGTSLGDMPNNPCGPNLFGEYEDYRIILRPDATPPVITIKGLNPVYLAQCTPNYIDSGAVAEDNIDGIITSKIVSNNNLDLNKAGTYWYKYNVKDSKNNNAIEAVRTIIIKPDNVPPVLNLLGNITESLAVDSTWKDPFYLVSDTCSGVAGVTVSSTINNKLVGTYEITYTATDSAGNSTSVKRNVMVIDTILPQISLIGSSTVLLPVFGVYTDSGANVSDNYYKNLSYTITGKVNTSVIGIYKLVYSVTDSSGNGPASVTRTVEVIDTEAPLVTSGEYNDGDTIKVEVFDYLTEPVFNVVDNYYKTFSKTITGTYISSFPTLKATSVGFYTYTANYSDGSGNTGTFTLIIHVVDSGNPAITMFGLQSVTLCRYQEISSSDDSTAVTDNYYSTVNVIKTGTYFTDYLPNKFTGFYSIHYNATDGSGNKAEEVIRYVNVINCDLAVPEASLSRSIKLYPNPNAGLFVLEINLARLQLIDVIVTNTMGQCVKVYSKMSASRLNIDLGDVVEGIYSVRIQTTRESTIREVIITR